MCGLWLRIRLFFNPGPPGKQFAALRANVRRLAWRFWMAIDPVVLQREVTTLIVKLNELDAKLVSKNAALVELNNVKAVEEAKVAAARAAADAAIASYEAVYTTLAAEAEALQTLTTAQRFHIGGVIGVTPETVDPTPEETGS